MFPWLTIITLTPLVGAVLLLFIPKGKDNFIKNFSIVWSLIPFALGTALWLVFFDPDSPKMQFEELAQWIPSIGVGYHVGVDGLSIPLVWLTGLLTTLGLFYSARVITERVREFFFMFLLLETGMLCVFVSLDFFLFYVFWEL